MNKLRIIGVLLIIGLLALAVDAHAAEDEFEEPYAGSVLCKPGIEGECLKLGPAAYFDRMAAMGIKLPFQPLAMVKPDFELTYLPYLYGQVVTQSAPVYGNIEDAAKSKNPIYRLEGNFSYISYEYTEVYKEVRVYMIAPGVWMNANNVHRVGSTSFQGLVFNRTPRNPFGWILQPVETKATPGYQTPDYTGTWVNRLEIVEVLGIEIAGDLEWVMIEPGQWIEKRYVGLVRPNTTPPKGVDNGRWIDINLYEQTIAVYENRRLVYASVISSGIDPFWTRPGLFQIYQKLESTKMSGSFEADRSDYYYLEDVPWTMYFDDARALHGAYWHTGYGYPRSHGCVNMAPGDAQWVFLWAQEGDWVYVHDPSGTTPEDPSLYTAGGA